LLSDSVYVLTGAGPSWRHSTPDLRVAKTTAATPRKKLGQPERVATRKRQ